MIKFIIIEIIIILVLMAFVLIIKSKEKTNKEPETENSDLNKLPYKKCYLLTKNEWYFYKRLKNICDKNNLHIIAKVRFADLVEIDKAKIDKNEYIKYFNKINKKHVDFVLCNPENLKVIALIELDDNSHKNNERINRDKFIDEVCKITDYKIIHITQNENLEEKLINQNIIKKEFLTLDTKN